MPPNFSTAGHLYWGAIHAHSSISRCSGPKADGDLNDMYVFAREAVGLDFFAITDHDNDLRLDDRWERSKDIADRFNEPGHFVSLCAYEWTSWPYGHLNVYFLDRDAPLFVCTDKDHLRDPNGHTPRELWDSLRRSGVEAMTIPHHVAVTMFRVNWDYFDPDFEPVTEIASGWGRFEFFGNERPGIISDTLPGYFVQDALERGYPLGFVCGSDAHDGRPAVGDVHWRSGPAGKGVPPSIATASGNPLGVQPADVVERFSRSDTGGQRGLTAVYAPELTREAVFRAIQSRRCYGTTGARILLDVWLNGRPMGKMLTIEDPQATVTIQVKARGTDLVDEVDIIKNGQVVYQHPEEESLVAGFSWTDPEVSQPDNYYYVRVRQADGHMAWSSPVWVHWACYNQVSGHQVEYTDWASLHREFHHQIPSIPQVDPQWSGLMMWQVPLKEGATRLCLRWRGAEGEVCAGRLSLPEGTAYRLRDRGLSIERYGGDLYTDDGAGTVRWHAGCGSAWRGIDVAIARGRGKEVTLTPERLPEEAMLWIDGQLCPYQSMTVRLVLK